MEARVGVKVKLGRMEGPRDHRYADVIIGGAVAGELVVHTDLDGEFAGVYATVWDLGVDDAYFGPPVYHDARRAKAAAIEWIRDYVGSR